jgi:hypothetical protein
MDWLRQEVSYKIKGLSDKIELTQEDVNQKLEEARCLQSFIRVTTEELKTLERVYEIILHECKDVSGLPKEIPI